VVVFLFFGPVVPRPIHPIVRPVSVDHTLILRLRHPAQAHVYELRQNENEKRYENDQPPRVLLFFRLFMINQFLTPVIKACQTLAALLFGLADVSNRLVAIANDITYALSEAAALTLSALAVELAFFCALLPWFTNRICGIVPLVAASTPALKVMLADIIVLLQPVKAE